MEELVFRVQVESDDPENDRAYLNYLVQVLRLITENIAPFGYTDDETISMSEINHVAEAD